MSLLEMILDMSSFRLAYDLFILKRVSICFQVASVTILTWLERLNGNARKIILVYLFSK